MIQLFKPVFKTKLINHRIHSNKTRRKTMIMFVAETLALETITKIECKERLLNMLIMHYQVTRVLSCKYLIWQNNKYWRGIHVYIRIDIHVHIYCNILLKINEAVFCHFKQLMQIFLYSVDYNLTYQLEIHFFFYLK